MRRFAGVPMLKAFQRAPALSISRPSQNIGERIPESLRCLALVTDAFGGSGGIAQYNRDLLSAGRKQSIRYHFRVGKSADKRIDAPAGIVQWPPRGKKPGTRLPHCGYAGAAPASRYLRPH